MPLLEHRSQGCQCSCDDVGDGKLVAARQPACKHNQRRSAARILPLNAKQFSHQGMFAISIVGLTYVARAICDGMKPACEQTEASLHHAVCPSLKAHKLMLLVSSSHWQAEPISLHEIVARTCHATLE